MKRYEVEVTHALGAQVVPHEDGDYVLYTDFQSLQAERDRLRMALRAIAEDDYDKAYEARRIARKALEGGG